MHRLFGKSKPKEPAPTLDDASKSADTRGKTLDDKLKGMDAELAKFKTQLSKMKPGAAKKNLQQRALRLLQQKKVYEKQRDAVYSQQFNIDQAKFATETVKDTKVMVEAMKTTKTELKKAYKDIKISEVEDLHDDMNDLLEDADEIQDVLGRQYGVPEELDENDLMDELNALEGEIAEEELETEETPSYLVNAATAAKSAKEQKTVTQPVNNSSKDEKEEVDVDEYGLPKVPLRQLKV